MKNVQMANFLKVSRDKVQMTQKQVSDELGFGTSQFVSNWERGASLPPVKYFKALGRLYGVDPRQILEIHLQEVFKWDKEKITKRFQRSK